MTGPPDELSGLNPTPSDAQFTVMNAARLPHSAAIPPVVGRSEALQQQIDRIDNPGMVLIERRHRLLEY